MNRIFLVGSIALATAGVLMTSQDHAEAAKQRRFRGTKDLVVTLATPTTNQEVLTDLSDPGLNNRITIRFSSAIRRRDIIDNQNPFNRLTSKAEFFDSGFNRLPGNPRVRANVFTFDPLGDFNDFTLANGQYTLNLKRSIRNRRGRLLNKGERDFTTTFSVGTDRYPPVLRKISPINGQQNIGLNQRIVATFNEPVDPSSIISTITVQDASTNPPTLIPALGGGTGITLERNGFDVVFTPDPCFGYPPRSSIQMIIQGRIVPTPANPNPTQPAAVTDVFGNLFERDPGGQWVPDPTITSQFNSPNGVFNEATGQFTLTFLTRGARPTPTGLIPGGSQNVSTAFALPCGTSSFFAPSCMAGGNFLFYNTGSGIGEASLQTFISRFNSGTTELGTLFVVPNSPVRVGNPVSMVVDPRFDPVTLHTFLYVVDRRTSSVAVLDSRNLQVIGRFGGFAQARDISVGTDFGLARVTLFVSDFGSNQVAALDLSSIVVSFGGQPGAQSVCDAISDPTQNRIFTDTGRGPTSVSAETVILGDVMICNTLDNSVTVLNQRDLSLRGTHEVGSAPVDCDFSLDAFGGNKRALIVNQGGPRDPDGSVSVFYRGPGRALNLLIGGNQLLDGVQSTLTDGVKNPTNVWGNQQWAFDGLGRSIPQVWYVANSGGDTVLQITQGSAGLFGAAIVANSTPFEVGLNPTSALLDPFFPNAFVFAAVAGTGQIAGLDPARPLSAEYSLIPGVRRLFTTYSH